MIKISVLYPYKDGAAFNMDYYLNRHMPMVRDTLGAACKGTAIEQGLSGPAPGSHPAFVAMGHILMDSVEGVPGGLCPAWREIHGRHPELHGDRAGHPDQRRQNIISRPRPPLGGVAIRPM